MSSLAELPKLFGFFSYSREDDDDSDGALSALRNRIQRELRVQLGRTRGELKLFQDTVGISHGALWQGELEAAVAQSLFFVPIITPTAVNSRHCKVEFELFLKREAQLGREDLIFPILYVKVPALENEDQRRKNDVLPIIHVRQFANWTDIRLDDVASPAVGRRIERFCQDIVAALQKPWVSPEERQRKAAEAERQRLERHARQKAKPRSVEREKKMRGGGLRRNARIRKRRQNAKRNSGRRLRQPRASTPWARWMSFSTTIPTVAVLRRLGRFMRT
jgi:hypothetical protein